MASRAAAKSSFFFVFFFVCKKIVNIILKKRTRIIDFSIGEPIEWAGLLYVLI